MLVEESLVAVISLPAGVFNPYSGVKTSILILDRALARRAGGIAFFRIENDGFGLGTQRQEIEANDLPQARAEIVEYLDLLTANEGFGGFAPRLGQVVPKEEIIAGGAYSLSGERYMSRAARSSKYPTVPLGDVCDLIGGGTPSKGNKSYWSGGTIKWISSRHVDDSGRIVGSELITERALAESATRMAPKGATIVITRVSVGKFAIEDDDYAINQDLTALVSKDSSRLMPEFVPIVARHIAAVVERSATGIGVRGVTRTFLANIQVPLPPLGIQRDLVADLNREQDRVAALREALRLAEVGIEEVVDRAWDGNEPNQHAPAQAAGMD